MDPLDSGKKVMARKMLQQMTPSETPIVQALAEVVASIENQQAQVVEQLRQVADLDVEHEHDPERRQEVLLELADAVADDDFAGWWFREVADDHLENAGAATKYAGLEAEEWAGQKREWYRQYQQSDLVDDPLEEADQDDFDNLADRHLREMYGVGLEEFRELVVDWSQAEAAEAVLAGQIHRHTRIIATAAEEVEQLQDRVDELEEQVDADI